MRKLFTRLTTGEKRNRKRMAEVAAIYTVPRFVRTPIDILADLYGEPDPEARRERRARRPKVRNKRVFASVERDPQRVIDETFQDAQARDPEHRRTWVVLLDGNKDQIALAKAAARKIDVKVTVVVDVMHVLEYLWRAAYAFCETDEDAESWVQQRLMWLLQGGRRQGRHPEAPVGASRGPGGSKLAAVRDAADYLQDVRTLPALRRRDRRWPAHRHRRHRRRLPLPRQGPHGARWRAMVARRGPRPSCGFAPCAPAATSMTTGTSTLSDEHERNHLARYADGAVPHRSLRSCLGYDA